MNKKHKKWISVYLQNLLKNNRSGHTILNYKKDLEHFLEWYEALFLGNISKASPRIVSNYFFELSGQGRVEKGSFFRRFIFKKKPIICPKLSISSRKRRLSSIKNFYEFLGDYYDSRAFRTSPVKKRLHSIKLKDIDIDHTKLLRKEEFERVLYAAKGRQETLILKLLFYGGLRLSELCDLKVGDLHRRDKTLYLRRKGGKIHRLKMENFYETYTDYDNYVSYYQMKSQMPLFPNKNLKAISKRGMSLKIEKMLKRVNLDHSPHSFRKGCATYLYKKTKDLLFVRDYLNHNDAKVTQTYIEI